MYVLIKLSTLSCLEIRMQEQNHSVRIDNNTFERVEEFKYLGTTLTIQNSFVFQVAVQEIKD